MAETAASLYVVLRQVATGDEKYPAAWVVLKTVQARSQEEAIKAAADATTDANYTAVPSRSWQPVHVIPSTVTTFALQPPAVVTGAVEKDAPAESTVAS